MALTAVRSLLVARGQTIWNRVHREAGSAGIAGTGVVVLVLLLVAVLPGGLCLRLGLDLGAALASSSDLHGAVVWWNSIQAIFTILFAAAGGFRHSIAFPETSIRWLPIRSWELLLAEMPASLVEVFPLLGLLGIAATNLGLAVRMPGLTPAIAVIAVVEIGAMCALIVIVGSIRRALARRKAVVVVLAGALVATFASIGAAGARSLIREAVSAVVAWWPTSLTLEGFVLFRSGAAAGGAIRLALGLGGTILLIALAARLLGFERTLDARQTRTGREESFRFRGTVRGIAALFRKELLDTRMGRLMLAMPLLFSGPFAIFVRFAEFDRERGNILAEMKDLPVAKIEALPALAIFLVLIVLLDAQIWMNQFGWDRKAIRSYFQLPIVGAAVLLGKFLGLVQFVVLQVLVGVVPILWVHRTSAHEAVSGLAAAGLILVGVTVVGQIVSVRFPRAVERDGGSNVPFYLSWISTVTAALGIGTVVAIHAIGSLLGIWGGPILLIVAAIAAVVGYVALARVLGDDMRRNDERLLAM